MSPDNEKRIEAIKEAIQELVTDRTIKTEELLEMVEEIESDCSSLADGLRDDLEAQKS